MNRSWFEIIVAAFFEVCWVVGLKHSVNLIQWMGTVIAIVISFYLLIKATQKLPVGTAYAVFVGLGTTGTVLLDAILFKESLFPLKVIFVALLLVGVIGLKKLTDQKEGN
ncbi:DMT family transporter [Enterococcus sp. LJL98]